MKAIVNIAISGAGNCWKVAEPNDSPSTIQQRHVVLQIQGDDVNGYHLISSPDGCFTSDSWHESKAEAIQSAKERFGGTHIQWQ